MCLHTLRICFKRTYMQMHTHLITHSVWPRLQSHAGPSLYSHLFIASWPHPNLPRLSTSLRAEWQQLHLWPLKVLCTVPGQLSAAFQGEQCYLHHGWDLLAWRMISVGEHRSFVQVFYFQHLQVFPFIVLILLTLTNSPVVKMTVYV